MEKIIKYLKKNWGVISIVGTLLSSFCTGAWYVVERIAKAENTITNLSTWVSGHDDDIQNLHDDVLKLKEDERIREAGLLK